jgi:hypothetical protein
VEFVLQHGLPHSIGCRRCGCRSSKGRVCLLQDDVAPCRCESRPLMRPNERPPRSVKSQLPTRAETAWPGRRVTPFVSVCILLMTVDQTKQQLSDVRRPTLHAKPSITKHVMTSHALRDAKAAAHGRRGKQRHKLFAPPFHLLKDITPNFWVAGKSASRGPLSHAIPFDPNTQNS